VTNAVVELLRKGTAQDSHPRLAAVIVHPELKTVWPRFPEAISRPKSENKTDGERHAATRLLPAIRAAVPKLQLIVLEDSLAANAGSPSKPMEVLTFNELSKLKVS